MAPKIRYRTFRNYNDLEWDNRLSWFKYLIEEQCKEIYISIDIKKANHELNTTSRTVS